MSIKFINTGTNTNDATAIADDILLGKTAYAKGEKINGTLQYTKINNAAYLFSYNNRINQLDEILSLCYNVTSTENMFMGSTLDTLDLSNFNTDMVENMSKMFFGTSFKNQEQLDLRNINTSKVKKIESMFRGCDIKQIELGDIDFQNITSTNDMFYGCYIENLNLNPYNTSNIKTMNNMFFGCKLKSFDLSKWDTSNVTSMYNMFQNCQNLASIEISDLSNVNDISYMFRGCPLKNIDFSNSNMINANNISGLFYDCNGIENIEFANCNFGKVKNLYAIFSNCSSLTNLKGFLDLGKGYTQKTTGYTYYTLDLSYCPNLTHESLINIINNVYDLNLAYNVASGGTLYRQILNMGSTNKAKLTDEEIAIANDKGWNVT